MSKLLNLFASMAVLASAGAAQAAVVAYNEAISGDLSLAGTPLHTFTFDIGANTISGNTANLTSNSDYDSFAFVVPVGTEVVSATVRLVDVAGNLSQADWELSSGSLEYRAGSSLQIVSAVSPGTTTFATTGLHAGSYNMSAFGLSRIGAVDSSADYTFTFAVRAVNQVPEPAPLALLAAAGLAAAWTRRAARRA